MSTPVSAHNARRLLATIAIALTAISATTAASAAMLPDGRVWELVSPAEKAGARIEAITKEGGIISAAQNGTAMTYVANAPVGTPEGNPSLAYSQILATRKPTGGWATQDLAAKREGEPAGLTVGELDEYYAFSPNLSRAVLEPHGSPPLAPLLAPENSVLLREDLLETPPSPVYNPLANNQNTPPGTSYGKNTLGNPTVRYVAASGNLEHIILESTTQLTSTPGSGLYEWSNDTLTPISILPNQEFISEFNAKLGDYSTSIRDAVSENGDLVFWSTFRGGSSLENHLYVREVPQERTVQIDVPQDVAPPENSPEPFFEYATPDGERVYFKDGQRLTADSTAKREEPELYEYNTVTGVLTDLTPNPEGSAGESSDVWGEVIGASDNGEYVYLVSKGALNSETAPKLPALAGQSPEEAEAREEAREYKLYEIHNINGTHTPTLITTLTSQDRHDWEDEEGAALERIIEGLTSRMSPDGKFLEFMSDLPLKSSDGTHVVGYDNRDAVSDKADEEVFEYNAATSETVCVSCNPSGARPHGVFDTGSDEGRSGEGIGLLVDRQLLWEGRWLAASVPGWTTRKLKYAEYQSRYLLDSGRLFFDSADPLVPGDTNSKEDVYEYQPAGIGGCAGSETAGGGCVALISSGSSPHESAFLDASETGDDVFFLTAAPLVDEDKDTSYDVYDAHVCTTTAPCSPASDVPSLPCTSNKSCQGNSPAVPGSEAPLSSTFQGTSNKATVAVPPPLTRAQKLKIALRACAHKKPRARRKACEALARKHYAVAAKKAVSKKANKR